MTVYLNAGGGVAGDMLCAGLLGLGADEERVLSAMEYMGSCLGRAGIALEVLPDEVRRLKVSLEDNERHLPATRAREILRTGLEALGLPPVYLETGMRALEILISAEKEAHQKMPEMDHHIHAHHTHGHDHLPRHEHHDHHHEHPHHDHPGHHHDEHAHDETYLHEAQDIVLDIGGVMTALWSLGCEPRIGLLAPLAVGGGTVRFSHGTLSVPAPAVRVILDRFVMPWCHGPIDQELCTPTGAALLAALGAGAILQPKGLETGKIGRSRGTRPYDVPPLTLHLV